jgi:hypothetical protein
MKISILAALSIIVIISISTNYAFALTQTNQTVTIAGLDNGVQTYVGITPNPDSCGYGGVYFNDSNTRSMALSIAMAALLSGK